MNATVEHARTAIRPLRVVVVIGSTREGRFGPTVADWFVRQAALRDAFGWGLDRAQWLTVNAMKSAFIPFDERLELIEGAIKPGYAKLTTDI